MTRPLVLVTGAGGFLGGWVAEALHLSRWAQVRAGITRWSSAARIARFPLDIVTCNVLDANSLDAALKGVEYVIHCARSLDNSVAVGGTKLLLERAGAAGVKKVVFTSSVAVYGDAVGLVTEDTVPVGSVTEYGQGKSEAERICREHANDDFCVAAIRPTLVYGPFSEQWSVPYIARFASRRWTALGPRGEGKCNLVYVGDVVRLAQFLIETDFGAYGVFNANGPQVPTWNSYIERFNAALGFAPLPEPDKRLGLKVALRRPIRKLGKYALTHHRDLLVLAAARSSALRSMMKNVELDLRLRPNDDEMQRFATDVTYSGERAAKAGFVAKTSVDEGIGLTADWARRVGLV